MISDYITDAREYLDRVGGFLRQRPLEHSVLLSVMARHLGETDGIVGTWAELPVAS